MQSKEFWPLSCVTCKPLNLPELFSPDRRKKRIMPIYSAVFLFQSNEIIHVKPLINGKG